MVSSSMMPPGPPLAQNDSSGISRNTHPIGARKEARSLPQQRPDGRGVDAV